MAEIEAESCPEVPADEKDANDIPPPPPNIPMRSMPFGPFSFARPRMPGYPPAQGGEGILGAGFGEYPLFRRPPPPPLRRSDQGACDCVDEEESIGLPSVDLPPPPPMRPLLMRMSMHAPMHLPHHHFSPVPWGPPIHSTVTPVPPFSTQHSDPSLVAGGQPLLPGDARPDLASTPGIPNRWLRIPDSPWSIVITTTGYRYFFNNSTGASVWDIPEELEELFRCGAVDRLMAARNFEQIDPARFEEPAAQQAPPEDARPPPPPPSPYAGATEEETKPPADEEDEEVPEEVAVPTETLELLRHLSSQRLMREILDDIKLSRFTTFERALPRLIHDSRFSDVPKQHRRDTFEKAMREIQGEQRRAETKTRKESLEAFKGFLEEIAEDRILHAASTMESLEERFKDHNVWNSLPAVLRQNLALQRIEKEIQIRRHKRDQTEAEFKTLISEVLSAKFPDWMAERDRPLSYRDIRPYLVEDSRYHSLRSATTRADLFLQVMGHAREDGKRRVDEYGERERSDDLVVKRQRLQDEEARNSLWNLFAERLKCPFGLSYEAASRLLASETRLSQCTLKDGDRRIVFQRFVETLQAERVEQFGRILRSHPTIAPTTTFEECMAETGLLEDRRFKGIDTSELQSQFDAWKEEEMEDAVHAFKLLLRSTPLITSETPEEGAGLGALMQSLASDRRYKRLEADPERRKQLVVDRTREMKGRSRREGEVAEEDDDIDYLQWADAGDD